MSCKPECVFPHSSFSFIRSRRLMSEMFSQATVLQTQVSFILIVAFPSIPRSPFAFLQKELAYFLLAWKISAKVKMVSKIVWWTLFPVICYSLTMSSSEDSINKAFCAPLSSTRCWYLENTESFSFLKEKKTNPGQHSPQMCRGMQISFIHFMCILTWPVLSVLSKYANLC